MGDGMSSGFFKEETAQKRIQQNTLSRALYHFSIFVVTQSFLTSPLGIRLGHFR
jgi:hypothetical protein